jgi:hypothetical protein
MIHRYELTNEALVEHSKHSHFSYGRWDRSHKAFVTWQKSAPTAEYSTFPITPTWPVISNLRDPLAATEYRPIPINACKPGSRENFPEAKEVLYSFECRELDESSAHAIDEYLSLIPNRIYALAMLFGEFQWIALEAMRNEATLADYLEADLGSNSPAFLFTCWSLLGANKIGKPARAKFNRRLLQESQIELLTSFLNGRSPTKALPSINKIDLSDFTSRNVLSLFDCLKYCQKTVAIENAGRLTGASIAALHNAPSWLIWPNFINDVSQYDAEEDKPIIWVMLEGYNDMLLEAPISQRGEITNSLVDANNLDEFIASLESWEERLSTFQ